MRTLFCYKSALHQFAIALIALSSISGCSLIGTKISDFSQHQPSDDLNELLQLPHLQDYIAKHEKTITPLLLKGDENSTKEFLRSTLACEAVMLIESARMTIPTLYSRQEDGSCQSVNWKDKFSNYAIDPQCNRTINYEPPSKRRFCQELLGGNGAPKLGDAGSWQPNDTPINGDPTRKWTLAYGTRLYVTALPLKNNRQPFMKRVRYKKIGQCQLEMRIYKKDPTAQGLKPMLAIHGGKWQFRGLGFAGLESEVSHFTDRGYIVFAPFYRLVGDAYDLTDCQNAAWKKIVADAESALDWVRANGEVVGAKPDAEVLVFGQSAGAHLSGWLLSHRQEQIAGAMLYYPPTDFEKFVAEAKPGGEYADYQKSLGILRKFLGMKEGDKYDPEALRLNTFPHFIDANSPPIFILHGDKDVIVPADQSQQICNAYNPSNETLDSRATSLINYINADNYHCGAKGTLTRLNDANHMLDLRCFPTQPCPSGGLLGCMDTKESMAQGYKWLNSTTEIQLTHGLSPR
ncbi:MAG: alpha/beta hydrolase fold domain-containing protein [Gammaproteobacteria bacterium]|nr:alpha/beta hydrolase fold domain-containing protein [Gammaproteobacteria bacterium]